MRVRFQDCDPFNHLNNSKYIDYFINAREDQILEEYHLDLFDLAFKHKIGWVVSSNQIAYLFPAFPNEKLVIESQLIDFNQKSIFFESRMWDEKMSRIKSLAWFRLVHVHLEKPGSLEHNAEFMKLFESVVTPVDEKVFEARIASFKIAKVI